MRNWSMISMLILFGTLVVTVMIMWCAPHHKHNRSRPYPATESPPDMRAGKAQMWLPMERHPVSMSTAMPVTRL